MNPTGGMGRAGSPVVDPPGLVLYQVRLRLTDPDGNRRMTLTFSALSADVPGAVMCARRAARFKLGWPESQAYVERVTLRDGTDAAVPPACLVPPIPAGVEAEVRFRRVLGLGHLGRSSS